MRMRTTGTLIGIAFAVVVVGGCGESDSATESDAKPTATQYRAEVRGICEDNYDKLDELDGSAREVIDDARAIERDLDDDLADVEPPSSLTDEHDELVDALRAMHQLDVPEWIADGVDASDDPAEVEEFGRQYEAALVDVEEASERVGITSCAPESEEINVETEVEGGFVDPSDDEITEVPSMPIE